MDTSYCYYTNTSKFCQAFNNNNPPSNITEEEKEGGKEQSVVTEKERERQMERKNSKQNATEGREIDNLNFSPVLRDSEQLCL